MNNEQKIVLDILSLINFHRTKMILVSDKIYQLVNNELSDNWGFYLNFPNQWLIKNTVFNCRIIKSDIPEDTIEIITKVEQWTIEN